MIWVLDKEALDGVLYDGRCCVWYFVVGEWMWDGLAVTESRHDQVMDGMFFVRFFFRLCY